MWKLNSTLYQKAAADCAERDARRHPWDDVATVAVCDWSRVRVEILRLIKFGKVIVSFTDSDSDDSRSLCILLYAFPSPSFPSLLPLLSRALMHHLLQLSCTQDPQQPAATAAAPTRPRPRSRPCPFSTRRRRPRSYHPFHLPPRYPSLPHEVRTASNADSLSPPLITDAQPS